MLRAADAMPIYGRAAETTPKVMPPLSQPPARDNFLDDYAKLVPGVFSAPGGASPQAPR